jgi:hypothetical protein
MNRVAVLSYRDEEDGFNTRLHEWFIRAGIQSFLIHQPKKLDSAPPQELRDRVHFIESVLDDIARLARGQPITADTSPPLDGSAL